MSEVVDALRDLLPHGAFTISTRRLDTRAVVVAHCRCGRKFDMLDSLPSDVLLWWLVDHDDDMFLTADQLEAKWSAVAPGLPGSDMLKMMKAPFTLPPMGGNDA